MDSKTWMEKISGNKRKIVASKEMLRKVHKDISKPMLIIN